MTRILNAKINPRFAPFTANGFHPFQEKTISILRSETCPSIVEVEAPVGAGKSRILQELIFGKRDHPLILTYPTKILIDSQLKGFREENPQLRILPWDSKLTGNSIGMVEYSGGSIMQLARTQKLDEYRNRSDLLGVLFNRLFSMNDQNCIVTTPDVLHLLTTGKYKNAYNLQRYLKGGIFVFDEFHVYQELGHFYRLLEVLLDRLEGTALLMSATPLSTQAMKEILDRWPSERVKFTEGDNLNYDRCFNYKLDLKIHESFPTNKIEEETDLLISIFENAATPAAFICDSLFRLDHLKRRLIPELKKLGYHIIEWSGKKKEPICDMDKNVIVLGTAAIEVGIDFEFKTLVTEASAWASAIQRIGRAGRRSPSTVHLITRKRVGNCMENDQKIARTTFEKEILSQVFRYIDPRDYPFESEMFRGDVYPFAIYDSDMEEAYFGDESLFGRYNITEFGHEHWRNLNQSEKRRELATRIQMPEKEIKETLLQDRVFPFWSVIRGRLADNYKKVYAKYSKRRKTLFIYENDSRSVAYNDKDG